MDELFFDNIYALIQNAILLFALVFIYASSNINPKLNKVSTRIIAGIIIGICNILIMLNPWKINEGLFFDTRTVLIGVTGIFFGPTTTIISAGIALIYRSIIGGSGIVPGLLIIITAAALGLSWKYIKKILPKMNKYLEYYLFGLILHLFVNTYFLLVPNVGVSVFFQTMIPFIGMFPIFTLLLSLTIVNQETRFLYHNDLVKQKALLQASLDSAKTIEIFAYDKNLCYISFNECHQQKIERIYKVKIKLGDSLYNILGKDIEKHDLTKYFLDALEGKIVNRTYHELLIKDTYSEVIFMPIYNQYKEIIGVNVFSQNVTEKKKYEESIIYATNHDSLTTLYNRKYYLEAFAKYDHPNYYPLSLITADINGLKLMNDAFGHREGDKLLVIVSEVLLKVFKEKGIVFRMGGDEFLILLPKTTFSETKTLIDQANKCFEGNPLNGMNISVAFGFAVKESSLDEVDLYKSAEDYMYKKKLFATSSHRNESIKTIMATLYEKNPREQKHSSRVSSLAISLAKHLKMSKDEVEQIETIGNLHDIGKIAVDDVILNKPGKLDPLEWEAIKKHPEVGYRILIASPDYADIASEILYHHERYDGFGYPKGIKGEEIPIEARIIAICDSYDAMTSNRPYRKAMSKNEALEEIKKCSGTQFDPELAKAFIHIQSKNVLD